MAITGWYFPRSDEHEDVVATLPRCGSCDGPVREAHCMSKVGRHGDRITFCSEACWNNRWDGRPAYEGPLPWRGPLMEK